MRSVSITSGSWLPSLTPVLRTLGRTVALPVLAGAGFLLLAQPAEAQLRVCNKSNETVSMALTYRVSGQPQGEFISEGWFVAKAGECPTLVGGPLKNRYYYVRGEGLNGARWQDDYPGCLSQDKFSYSGGANCRAGFEARGFFQIDTGDASAWTHNLTPAPAVSDTGMHTGIADLAVYWRASALDDGTLVMQLRNAKASAVDVRLKCYTNAGDSKTFDINVPATGMAEVGFLQGWTGNFVAGERCEAHHGSERVWSTVAPRSI